MVRNRRPPCSLIKVRGRYGRHAEAGQEHTGHCQTDLQEGPARDGGLGVHPVIRSRAHRQGRDGGVAHSLPAHGAQSRARPNHGHDDLHRLHALHPHRMGPPEGPRQDRADPEPAPVLDAFQPVRGHHSLDARGMGRDGRCRALAAGHRRHRSHRVRMRSGDRREHIHAGGRRPRPGGQSVHEGQAGQGHADLRRVLRRLRVRRVLRVLPGLRRRGARHDIRGTDARTVRKVLHQDSQGIHPQGREHSGPRPSDRFIEAVPDEGA